MNNINTTVQSLMSDFNEYVCERKKEEEEARKAKEEAAKAALRFKEECEEHMSDFYSALATELNISESDIREAVGICVKFYNFKPPQAKFLPNNYNGRIHLSKAYKKQIHSSDIHTLDQFKCFLAEVVKCAFDNIYEARERMIKSIIT